MEVPELCWSLFPGKMGNGYATEATIAARQWVYENHPHHQLVSYIHPDNSASCAVAKRLDAKLKCTTTLYGQQRLLFIHISKPGILLSCCRISQIDNFLTASQTQFYLNLK